MGKQYASVPASVLFLSISLGLVLNGCGAAPTASQGAPQLLVEQQAIAPEPESSAEPTEATRARRANPAPFEATLVSYNVLFQYRQVPEADGSFPDWVCRSYPFIVDHPELRWENRFPAITETLERSNADIIGLNEMRGGSEGQVRDGRDGPDVIGDMTRWLQSRGYRWVSVATVDPANVEVDQTAASVWPGPVCRGGMSDDRCANYDPRTDHFTTRNYLAYRAETFAVRDSGAIEIPTSLHAERRFSTWARLVERRSGTELVVVVAHLDPLSGAHRVAAARQLRSLVQRFAPTPVALLGDLNTLPNGDAECDCSCRGNECSCPAEVVSSCDAANAHAVLTGSGETLGYVDAQAAAGHGADSTTLRIQLGNSGGNWQSGPCWPEEVPGDLPRLPALAPIERGRARKDFVLVSPNVTVLDGRVLEPVTPTILVRGQPRTVHPSDHLPVVARLRVDP